MKTEQLEFWIGQFGEKYLERNLADRETISSRLMLWSIIFRTMHQNIDTILEVGSNIGNNLKAIKLISNAELYAIEPYENAMKTCVLDGTVKKNNAFCTSAFDNNIMSEHSIDLVFTSGVLIHIHPNDLKKATDNIVRIAKKYVVCVEYFSDREETVLYRGNTEKLFKRDFGSFYLDNYPELSLVDYGFSWKRITGLDNLTWWVFEKRN